MKLRFIYEDIFDVETFRKEIDWQSFSFLHIQLKEVQPTLRYDEKRQESKSFSLDFACKVYVNTHQDLNDEKMFEKYLFDASFKKFTF